VRSHFDFKYVSCWASSSLTVSIYPHISNAYEACIDDWHNTNMVLLVWSYFPHYRKHIKSDQKYNFSTLHIAEELCQILTKFNKITFTIPAWKNRLTSRMKAKVRH
jgi:hypothetical protein